MSCLFEELNESRLASGLNDKQILGSLLQSCDYDAEYLENNDCYAWYLAFGNHWKPKTILELGVRFGYSLKSLILGALKHHDSHEIAVYGFDNEQEDADCLTIVNQMLHDFHLRNYCVNNVNLRSIESFGVENVDLIHLDCDHRFESTFEDMAKSWHAVRTGGVVLIDDIKDVNVQAAMDIWCQREEVIPVYLPTYRGMYVVQKP